MEYQMKSLKLTGGCAPSLDKLFKVCDRVALYGASVEYPFIIPDDMPFPIPPEGFYYIAGMEDIEGGIEFILIDEQELLK